MMKDTMPLLEALLPDCADGKDTLVLHINHCMDNSFYFTEQLKKAFGQVVFVAVPYNDRGVPQGLSYPAYHGRQCADGYALMQNNGLVEQYAGDFLHAVRRMIELALDKCVLPQMERGKRLVIVEDGGYHYPVLRRWLKDHPALAEGVLGSVEQTTAGTRLSGEEERFYPMISVARSTYKIRVEAYFVADRVVGELKRMLRAEGIFIDFHDVLLLGYGIIGRSIARCLAPNHVRLFVRDIDAAIEQTAKEEGLSPWDGVFHEDMLVLGNSGKASFTREMLEAFRRGEAKRIFLASSSSKQIEFEAIFDDLAGAEKTCLDQAEAYRFPNGQEIVLLAQGFPLNFYDKSADSLTYSMIDPVFSEMLSSACALRDKRGLFQNRAYFFGVDQELGGYDAEKQLVERWMQLNHLHFDMANFNVHPRESHLREKALERD